MVARKKISGVYTITCLANGKSYVGSSVDIYGRWFAHCRNLLRKNHCNSHLQRAYDLYGIREFRFDVVEYHPIVGLREREQALIEIHGVCHNGFNKAKDTRRAALGMKKSAEAIERTAFSRRKRYKFLNPLGEAVLVDNLPKFAKDNHLKSNSLREVGAGKRFSHLGWRNYDLLLVGVADVGYLRAEGSIARKCYHFVNPKGELVTISGGLSHFCAKHKLSDTAMFRVAKGERKQHNGWRAYEPMIIGVACPPKYLNRRNKTNGSIKSHN